MSNQEIILFQVVEYLKSLNQGEGTYREKLTAAISCIESTFAQASSDIYRSSALCPGVGFNEIFEAGRDALKLQSFSSALESAQSNPKFESFVEVVTSKGYFGGVEENSREYLERYNKLITKFQQKTTPPSKAELEAKAEEFKLAGNAAMNTKDHVKAIELYTEALKCSSDGPNSHIYYCNRAAAHCGLQQHQESVDDCTQAIVLSPAYAKAYSRLGLSSFFLGRYEESVDAYERAVELEPDNKQSQDSLKSARNKLKKTNKAAHPDAPSSSSEGGLPDLSALMGGGGAGMPDMSQMLSNPKYKDAYEKAGGASGIANLMKDPKMMSMAQEMMKNPAMMQQAMQMMGGGGGGGGGMPDMSALMGMMGGGGGGVPSSSSSSGGKKFKGFEE